MTVTQTQLGSLSLKLRKSLEDRGIRPGQTRLIRSALDRMARLTALPHAGFCVPCREDAHYGSESIRFARSLSG
jgi:hypothetical protein